MFLVMEQKITEGGIMKKITTFILSLLLIFATIGSTSVPTEFEVYMKASSMDMMIDRELNDYNAIHEVYKLDAIIEAERPITDDEINEIQLVDLYHIDKNLVKKKLHSMTTRERRDAIKDAIDCYSDEYGVDANLIKAIAKAESYYNPYAKSNKGAVGIMQLMPKTARYYGVEDRHNAFDSVRGGIKFILYLKSKYKNVKYVIAAYNAGPGAVDKYNDIPPYAETQEYVKRVMKFYKEYKNADQRTA
jgi:hypothetical protein